MVRVHPDTTLIERFLDATASCDENRLVVEHLLRRCSECRQALARVQELRDVSRDPDYLAGLDRAIASASSVAKRRRTELAREARFAERFVERLREASRGQQRLLIANSAQGRWVAVCEELLVQGFAMRHDDPIRMAELIGLAFEIAVDLDEDRYGRLPVVDLRVRAAIEFSNALRVTEQMDLALSTLDGAARLFPMSSGDPLLRARLFDVAASILIQAHRWDLALELLEHVIRIYLKLGDRHLAGRALLKMAATEGNRTEPMRTVELLLAAAELIDPQRDRELVWTLIHTLLWSLADLGHYSFARSLLEECRYLYEEIPGRIKQLRRKWLEGRIAAGLGEDLKAEVLLIEVGHGFARDGKHYEAAIAKLDLALMYGRQSRTGEVRKLVEEMLTTFRAYRLERDAIAALLALRGALRGREMPIVLLKQVQAFLRSMVQGATPARRAGRRGQDEAEA